MSSAHNHKLMLCTLLCFFFVSSANVYGANQGEDTSSVKVSFINPGFENKGFWKAVTDTMSVAAGQLGFELEISYADRQWPAMVQQAENVINAPNDTDYLILVNEHQQAAKLLEAANKAGIPTLMLLNSLTEEQLNTHGAPREKMEHWLGSITPDNQIAGYEMAMSLLKNKRQNSSQEIPTIPMLTLAGDNATPASLYRLNGLDQVLNKHPELSEVRRISVNWSREEAYKRTLLWLENNQALSAVWSANDPIALGAMQAIKEKGLKPGEDVLVSGLNWSPEAVEAVLNGEMTLTHGGHFLAGAWIMVILYDYINGNDFKDLGVNISFPMTAIHQGNAQQYLEHFGAGDWSKVDFKRFTRTHSNNKQPYEFTLDKLLELADSRKQ